jgi:hypothetical protein
MLFLKIDDTSNKQNLTKSPVGARSGAFEILNILIATKRLRVCPYPSSYRDSKSF